MTDLQSVDRHDIEQQWETRILVNDCHLPSGLAFPIQQFRSEVSIVMEYAGQHLCFCRGIGPAAWCLCHHPESDVQRLVSSASGSAGHGHGLPEFNPHQTEAGIEGMVLELILVFVIDTIIFRFIRTPPRGTGR